MARVKFTSAFLVHTGGCAELEIEAGNMRLLQQAVLTRFPEMPGTLLQKSAVSIDGQIINSPFLEPLEPDSEVIFVGRIGAG